MDHNLKIEWSDNVRAKPHNCYESIAPLCSETRESNEHISFVASSTDYKSGYKDGRGCIHKLEVIFGPSLAQTKLRVSHEVLPKQGACCQIIPVNSSLRAACFDSGTVIPISNFGPKKTFHCNVRGRLRHHSAPINCLAANSKGTKLASGSTNGQIVLYDVCDEFITYKSRANVCFAFVSGIGYLKPVEDICLRPSEKSVCDDEDILVYSTSDGHIGLLDTRCDLGQQINFTKIMSTQPRLNLTSQCYIDNLPGQIVFFGSSAGVLIAVDLRYNNKYLVNQKLPEDGCIGRMKKVSIQVEDNKTSDFLVYTNGTNKLKIIDPASLEIDTHWECDQLPNGIIKDFCQVDKRIITCGSESSISCWTHVN